MMTMKNTKQELFDAYESALKELEQVKALKESPADVMEEKRKSSNGGKCSKGC